MINIKTLIQFCKKRNVSKGSDFKGLYRRDVYLFTKNEIYILLLDITCDIHIKTNTCILGFISHLKLDLYIHINEFISLDLKINHLKTWLMKYYKITVGHKMYVHINCMFLSTSANC